VRPVRGLDLRCEAVEVGGGRQVRPHLNRGKQIRVGLRLLRRHDDADRKIGATEAPIPIKDRPVLRPVQVKFEHYAVSSFVPRAAFAGQEGAQLTVMRTVADVCGMPDLFKEVSLELEAGTWRHVK
jgi:hypothetical protein